MFREEAVATAAQNEGFNFIILLLKQPCKKYEILPAISDGWTCGFGKKSPVSTTMIYAHGLNKGGYGVRRPVDAL